MGNRWRCTASSATQDALQRTQEVTQAGNAGKTPTPASSKKVAQAWYGRESWDCPLNEIRDSFEDVAEQASQGGIGQAEPFVRAFSETPTGQGVLWNLVQCACQRILSKHVTCSFQREI